MGCGRPPPQRKPLTDEQIDAIVRSNVTITDPNLFGAIYMSMRMLESAQEAGKWAAQKEPAGHNPEIMWGCPQKIN